MKPTRITLLSLALAAPIPAATVNWDGGGDEFWDTAENWDDDAAPAAGNDYILDASTARSPDVNATSFGGDSLTVRNGGILNLYRTNGGGYFTVEHAIPSLTLSDAELRPESSLGSIGHILTEAVALTGANTLHMNENSAFTMRMFFDGGVTGSGSLDVTRGATGSTRSFAFGGDASGYSGDISLAGVGSGDTMIFDVDNSAGWGGGSLTVGDFGELNLNSDFTSPTAGISMTTGGTSLTLGADATVAALEIGGSPVAPGTYDASDLTDLGLGGSYDGSGTLTVVPEPSSALLLVGGIGLAVRRRRR